jgi:CheY-like chemotaxis protein
VFYSIFDKDEVEKNRLPKTILIVDDTKDVRELLHFILAQQGYAIVEASDGEEAIKVARQEKPDLILMDFSLPVMDGLTATRIIKESEDFTDIPVICVTAHGSWVRQQALEAGCVDVIAKPVEFQQLTSLVSKYLRV